LVRCRDAINNGGVAGCNETLEVTRGPYSVGARGARQRFYDVKCPLHGEWAVPEADWIRLRNQARDDARVRPTDQDAAIMVNRINGFLADNVPDDEIISEITMFLESKFPAQERKNLVEYAKGMLESVKKKRGKEERETSDILCPECRAKKLIHVKDTRNKIDYYFCNNPKCPARYAKLSSRQVREKERVYWDNERENIRNGLTRNLNNNRITRDMYNDLLSHRLAVADAAERKASRGMFSYFKRKGSYKDWKEHYKVVLRKAKERRDRQLREVESQRRHMGKDAYRERRRKIKEKYRNIMKASREKKGKAEEERGLEGNPFTRWSEKYMGGEWGTHVTKILGILAMIILGMVISQYFEGNWAGNFTLGFILLGISTMMPGYKKHEGIDKISLNVTPSVLPWLRKYMKYAWRNKGSGAGSAAAKSAFKFFAVWFFITGARNATAIGFLANIVMIVVAAVSYFAFSSKYDPDVPGAVIESFTRFFIGIIIIPWWVFYGIFQSFVLGLMAMAFFAVPPTASKESGEQERVMGGEYQRWLFAIIMLVALAGSGIMGETVFGMPTWGLTGALKSTFFYFWLVCGIAGFFSPASQRPALGFIMLGAATMIYAVGPGTQQVGTALLGPWFGKAFVGLTDAMAPVTEAFNQIGTTFGTAFQMIVNPVGFAQGIMSGTYARDADTGLIGSYGVEVGTFRATPIYTNQSYSIIIPIENKGSADAKNIVVSLWAGTGVGKDKEGLKVKNLPMTETKYWRPFESDLANTMISQHTDAGAAIWNAIDKKAINIQQMGIIKEDLEKLNKDSYIQYTCDDTGKSCNATLEDRTLTKLDSDQIFFSSTGIPCSSVVEFGLQTQEKAKFLPFSAIISYDYSVESSLEIEALSGDEWARLAQQGLLYPGQKKPSTMANSPAMLNLDTLEQPIRERTPFFIALNLTPAIAGKGWVEDADVMLEVPSQLSKTLTDCTTRPSNKLTAARDTGIFKWEKGDYPTNRNAIYCYFGGMLLEEGNPTQTYYIRANASFRFNNVETKAFAFEFGGTRCCGTVADCTGEFKSCPESGDNKNVCTAGDGGGTNGGTGIGKGKDGFCESLASSQLTSKCPLGYGGCLSDDICEDPYMLDVGGVDTNVNLKCWTKAETGIDARICCPDNGEKSKCIAAFNSFMLGGTQEQIEAAYLGI